MQNNVFPRGLRGWLARMAVGWRALVPFWRCRADGGVDAEQDLQVGASHRHRVLERARVLRAVEEYLRQPLYALSLTSESLLRHSQRAPGPSALLQLKASLRSLDERLDALRLMASLDAGTLRPALSEFSMQPLLDRLDLAFGPVATGKGLRWDVTPSTVRVRSNPVLLEQMLVQLVGNAVRFTTVGGVVVSCRFSGTRLLLQVWDTGTGIDPKHQPHVFEAFYRGVAEAGGDTGSGLGLSIVQGGALAMGIDVALRSVPGRGTCFSLRVPLAEGAARGMSPREDGAHTGPGLNAQADRRSRMGR